MYGSMQDVLKDLPDVGTSWLRYMTALTRSFNREQTEVLDSYLIAAQIALQAAKDNPMTLRDTLEIMQHKSSLVGKGMRATQEKMADFTFDQLIAAQAAGDRAALADRGRMVRAFDLGSDPAGGIDRVTAAVSEG